MAEKLDQVPKIMKNTRGFLDKGISSLSPLILFFSQNVPFIPLFVGDLVVKGPDRGDQRKTDGEQVLILEKKQVKVKWSFFNRSWHTYGDKRREVMSKSQINETLEWKRKRERTERMK